jgi:hypothetical protein
MAIIQVSNFPVTVTLTRPDDDGDYGWTCTCGGSAESFQPIVDAIEHAGAHVDIYHKSESEN